MSDAHPLSSSEFSRRSALTAAFAGASGAFAFDSSLAGAFEPQRQVALADTAAASSKVAAGKKYEMKKSINLWAFPYPNLWSKRNDERSQTTKGDERRT